MNIIKMSSISILLFEFQKKLKVYIWSITNNYQYIVGNIILLGSTLCISSKNKMFMFIFRSLFIKSCIT